MTTRSIVTALLTALMLTSGRLASAPLTTDLQCNFSGNAWVACCQ